MLGWLYRVQVPGSATIFVNGALVAAGSQFTDQTVIDYAPRLLHEHFLWSSNHPSPFISVFRDEDHARNWATGLVKKNAGMACTIYQVNPFQLGVNPIFDATQLVRELNIDLPDAARSQAENEYLILRSIPAEAISLSREGATPERLSFSACIRLEEPHTASTAVAANNQPILICFAVNNL